MQSHSFEFRRRRFFNWFPLGLSYALLYMGRYNLTVAKNSLGSLMTKEDFGWIFGVGTFVYALAFLINGPIVDRIGGRFGMLAAMLGSFLANMFMGVYLYQILNSPDASGDSIRMVFSILYGLNMYFQSFGAVSIVKVNSHWFHVKERGGFSGIFGTMISSGIFLAFTVNGWLLDVAAKNFPDQKMQWVVFAIPAVLLALFYLFELAMLRNSPSEVGFGDFETGDAWANDKGDKKDQKPVSVMELYKRILTNPIILTIALIEFCTGVLRNGIMHWFPIYAKEVWALPSNHGLMLGGWDDWTFTFVLFGVALVSAILASKIKSKRGFYITLAALAFLTPFLQAGWGGILFVAGVIGANVAGWVSDLFFQSRRAPSAAALFALLALCSGAMLFSLAKPSNEVEWASAETGIQQGDRITKIADQTITTWGEVAPAVSCVPATCKESVWDPKDCVCRSRKGAVSLDVRSPGFIPIEIDRAGTLFTINLKDPMPEQRAGDRRTLKARPVLPMSPYVLGALVFIMSLCVIGTHGLLSGTATMDFGGRKGAATAVGVIDGFVYAGTAFQSVSLGYITTWNWAYWPVFMLPFTFIGLYLLTRIWHASPIKK